MFSLERACAQSVESADTDDPHPCDRNREPRGSDPAAVRRSILPTEVRETVKLYLDGKIDQWLSQQGRSGVVLRPERDGLRLPLMTCSRSFAARPGAPDELRTHPAVARFNPLRQLPGDGACPTVSKPKAFPRVTTRMRRSLIPLPYPPTALDLRDCWSGRRDQPSTIAVGTSCLSISHSTCRNVRDGRKSGQWFRSV